MVSSAAVKAVVFVVASSLFPSVSAHIALWHPSMWGFMINADTPTPYGGDNRPVIPLMGRKFSDWWFHGHLNFPPAADAIMQLPVGQTKQVELACDKGATSYYASSAGSVSVQTGDGNYPCPGYPLSQFHTTGINDLGGCALAVAYKSDVNDVQPEDFTVFSIQHQCVWTRWTDFDVPADMPPCPNGKCVCAWFWIHTPDSGSEQMYMTGFQCDFQNASSNKAVAKGQLPRRCGADPANGRPNATPSNCTVGAKVPFYWYQAEGNNMFEGTYSPPLYTDLYGFANGAQNDIFEGGNSGSPPPSSPVTTTKVVTTSKVNAPSSSKQPEPSSSQAPANPGEPGSSSEPKPTTSTKPQPATSSKPTEETHAPATTSHASPATTQRANPPPSPSPSPSASAEHPAAELNPNPAPVTSPAATPSPSSHGKVCKKRKRSTLAELTLAKKSSGANPAHKGSLRSRGHKANGVF